jgi:hypothetical protein
MVALAFLALGQKRQPYQFAKTSVMDKQNNDQIKQPTQPEDVTPEQKKEIKQEMRKGGKHLTANPGDRISDEPQTIEEKAQQVAVDTADITGDHITVPTYFIVDEPDGEKKALHHVKDADEISDVIRQARVDEDGNRVWW